MAVAPTLPTMGVGSGKGLASTVRSNDAASAEAGSSGGFLVTLDAALGPPGDGAPIQVEGAVGLRGGGGSALPLRAAAPRGRAPKHAPEIRTRHEPGAAPFLPAVFAALPMMIPPPLVAPALPVIAPDGGARHSGPVVPGAGREDPLMGEAASSLLGDRLSGPKVMSRVQGKLPGKVSSDVLPAASPHALAQPSSPIRRDGSEALATRPLVDTRIGAQSAIIPERSSTNTLTRVVAQTGDQEPVIARIPPHSSWNAVSSIHSFPSVPTPGSPAAPTSIQQVIAASGGIQGAKPADGMPRARDAPAENGPLIAPLAAMASAGGTSSFGGPDGAKKSGVPSDASQVADASQVGAPPAIQEVIQQALAQAVLLRQGQATEMRLRLRPPALGEVQITVRRDALGQLSAHLAPTTAAATAMLIAHQQDLRIALAQHSATGSGPSAQQVTISIGMEQKGGEHREQDAHPGAERQMPGTAPAESWHITAAAPTRSARTGSLIDYDA